MSGALCAPAPARSNISAGIRTKSDGRGLIATPILGCRVRRSLQTARTPLGAPRTSELAGGRAALGVCAAAAAAGPPPTAPWQQEQQPRLDAQTLARVPKWLSYAAVALACAAWVRMLATAPQHPAGLFASLSLAARATPEGLRIALSSAGAGLAAGCLHTLAGADHLAALTPLTIGRSHLRASLLGALWGFGHSTGQLMLGLAMVLLKDRFTALVPALTRWGGTAVGLTLLAIGMLGIYESYFEDPHAVDEEEASISAAAAAEAAAEHQAGAGPQQQQQQRQGQQYVVQSDGSLTAVAGGGGGRREKRGFGLATFASGIAFGLQPDALFVIVPALTLPTKLAAAIYIGMFVLGTVAAMGAYTGLIGATSAALKRNNSGLTKKLSGAASFVALAVGATVLLGGWGVQLPIALPFLGGAH